MDFQSEYQSKLREGRECADSVADGELIYLNGGPGYPNVFANALVQREESVRDVTIIHAMRREAYPLSRDYAAADMADSFRHVSDFSYDRPIIDGIRQGHVAYRPQHPIESARSIPDEVSRVACSVSPMDSHGYFSLGSFVYAAPSVINRAKTVTVEVNPHQPRVYGETFVHISRVDEIVEADYELTAFEQSDAEVSTVDQRIAENVAELITDGSTLQIGGGEVPDIVARLLVEEGRKDLGIHSEFISDPLIHLIESGIANGSKKTLYPHKAVGTVAVGSPSVYEFIDQNPGLILLPVEQVNDPCVIAKNARQVSVNATLMVDLMGQCASESIGARHYSGVGGQWEFHRGAYHSQGGKAIMVLRSTAKQGEVSNILPQLPQGTPISITRNDIDYLVTEHGVARLKGKSLDRRAKELVQLAHPSFREPLQSFIREQGWN